MSEVQIGAVGAGEEFPEATGPGVVSDKELERQVLTRQQAREKNETNESAEPRGTKDVLRAAQKDEPVSPEEVQDAVAFFLASEASEEEQPSVEPKTLTLNLGTKEKPRKVRWTVVPVEDTEITRLRRTSQVGTRQQKRRGEAEVDEAVVARKVVVRGTVDPDPKELARTLGTGPDPADAVHAFFSKYGKTGLITQISGTILSISGWDDEDVQEVEAARG